MPVQKPFAFVRGVAGRAEGLLGEVLEFAVRRQQGVAEELGERAHRLDRAPFSSLDPGFFQERQEVLQRSQVRHRVLLRQHGRGGDFIGGGAGGAHERQPLGIRASRARALLLVVRGAFLQRLDRDALLGVDVLLGQLLGVLRRFRGEGQGIRRLVPHVAQSLALPIAAAAAALPLGPRARARVPRAAASRRQVPGTKRAFLLFRGILLPLERLAAGAAQHATAARHRVAARWKLCHLPIPRLLQAESAAPG